MVYNNNCESKLLFLSADLINATEFKNILSDITKPLHWIGFMNRFHDDFPSKLKKYFGNQKSPEIWKSLGDELIFNLELESAEQAVFAVAAFWQTIHDFNDGAVNTLNAKHKGNSLGVKGTAWVANFPYINTQVRISKMNEKGEIFDFVGPQIDIGFRLTKFADRRRLIISVELTTLMVISQLKTETEMKFFYDGRKTLKGVWDNQPYPIIWVSLNNNLDEIDDILYKQCNPNDIRNFCLKLFKDSENSLRPPFIKGDPDFPIPEDYEKKKKENCQDVERFLYEPDEDKKDEPLQKGALSHINSILTNL